MDPVGRDVQEVSGEDAGTNRSAFRTRRWSALSSGVTPDFTRVDHPLSTRSKPAAHGVWQWLNRVQARVLVVLEQLPLRYPRVRRFMVEKHRRAFSRLLLAAKAKPTHICVVGGALFPRTLIVLRELLPDARITVLDSSLSSLDQAREHIGELDERTRFEHDVFDPRRPSSFDSIVIPVGYVGDRDEIYGAALSLTFVHDWVWRVRGDGGTVVSWLLMKRLNFVHGRAGAIAASPSYVSTDGCPTA